MEETKSIRKADFYSSLVIFAIGVYMILEASRYPWSGTYSGVTNTWYESPGLFPVFIGGVLALFSIALFVNAVRSGAAKEAFKSAGLGVLSTESNQRFFIVVAMISLYVYGLLARVDFLIGTLLFLQAFIGSFHFGKPAITRLNLVLPIGFMGVVALLGAFGVRRVRADTLGTIIDLVAVLIIGILVAYAYSRIEAVNRPKVGTVLLVASIFALFITFVFKFILTVPLPTEGLTILVLEPFWQWLRALLGG
jgi:hypothetical protein